MKPFVPLVLGALIFCCCLWSRREHVRTYRNYRGYCELSAVSGPRSCHYYFDPMGQAEMEAAVEAFVANATEFPVVMRGDFDVGYFHHFRAFAHSMEQKYDVTIELMDSIGLNISSGAPLFIRHTDSITIIITENTSLLDATTTTTTGDDQQIARD